MVFFFLINLLKIINNNLYTYLILVQLKIFSFNLIFNVEYVQYLLNFFVLPSQNQDLLINDTTKSAKQMVSKNSVI